MEEFKEYIGVKKIKARPMPCPSDRHNSKAGDPGYEVEYEDGYRSWSPTDVFEEAYYATGGGMFQVVLDVGGRRAVVKERKG